jgi:hypothetical protein
MKLFGKAFVSTGAASMLMALAIGVQPTMVVAAPQLTIQSEEAAHPRMVKAIHLMLDALHEMEAAPDDFGGNKAAAIKDARAAIHSARRALYFRLHMDDEALDRVQ